MKSIAHRRRPRARARGGIMVTLVLLLSLTVAGLSATMIRISNSKKGECSESTERVTAYYAAEAGVGNAVLSLYQGGTGALGAVGNLVAFDKGGYRTTCVDNSDGTYTITSYGTYRDDKRGLRATVQKSGGVFNNSMYAGNSSGDPTYSLRFGGTGGQADQIEGDVYSGKNINVSGGASAAGTLRAKGTITGASGQTGVTQPPLDLASMNYATTADVNVANEFASFGTYASNAAGGSAYQVPATKPSHIFRKNPSDRAANTAVTTKDDYFLEDPYETVREDRNANGSDATRISLSTTSGGGTDGNNKTYFIDGNLWIHNLSTLSFKFENGAKVTFVVKGNIYVCDNLFVTNQNTDGIGLVAMKDSSVSDSGNIYFGDPVFGTIEHMQAFMYAENNFYDNNLDELGSTTVIVDGTMAAGNQIAINRDFGVLHTKLVMNYDDRIASRAITMPGLDFTGAAQTKYVVVAQVEIQGQ